MLDMITPNFSRAEMSCRCGCGLDHLDEQFMKMFYQVFPGGQAWGHVDTDKKGKIDPGFDVPDFVRIKFGKNNVSTTGQTVPLSASEIRAAYT